MKKSTWLFLLALLFFALSFYLLTIPGKNLPEVGFFIEIPLFDKWVHMGMFSLLVFFFALAFKNKALQHSWVLPLIAALALSYGIAMEYVQKYYVANRSFDVTDILADGAGCIIGWWFSRWLFKRQQRKSL